MLLNIIKNISLLRYRSDSMVRNFGEREREEREREGLRFYYTSIHLRLGVEYFDVYFIQL